jgi:protein SCO1/2
MKEHWVGIVCAAALSVAVGCSKKSDAPGASPFDSMTADKSFQTRGEVREISKEGRTAVIRHEEIPGYMPRMTMELNVRNPGELRDIRAGDTVDFRLNVNGQTHWIDEVRKGKADTNPTVATTNPVPAAIGAATSAPVSASATAEALLTVGAEFPDVQLMGEDGRPFRLSELRGNAVALTFVFTRCPLPDFCPRMGQQFKTARRRMQQETGPTNWMFLSVSFDAEYDQPEVLKKYAEGYRGDSLDRWKFCAADAKALGEMSGKVGLTVVADGGGFSHNLRTVVLDPKGRLHQSFNGNLWTATELTESMRRAAGAK